MKFKARVKCNKRNNVVDVGPVSDEPNFIVVERREIDEKELSLSAVFNIVMTFYQLKALVTVKTNNDNSANAVIERFFNIELVSKGRAELDQLCAFHGVTVVFRDFLKGFGTTVTP